MFWAGILRRSERRRTGASPATGLDGCLRAIDRSGRVRYTYAGPMRPSVLRWVVRALLLDEVPAKGR